MKIQLLVFQSCRPQDFIQKNINCKCNSELEGKNTEKKKVLKWIQGNNFFENKIQSTFSFLQQFDKLGNSILNNADCCILLMLLWIRNCCDCSLSTLLQKSGNGRREAHAAQSSLLKLPDVKWLSRDSLRWEWRLDRFFLRVQMLLLLKLFK